MAEYLSPGVYVEEFESGPRPMEGVSTSTAGFIGLATKGPSKGNPVLVTNVADFGRKFGGHLSASEFGDYRYLSYAVEHFFLNGGSRCYVMRVVPSDAKIAQSVGEEDAPLKFYARNAGAWGNSIAIAITKSSKAKTQILEVEEGELGKKYRVKSAIGFNVGDIVVFKDGNEEIYNKVSKVQDNTLEFEEEFEADVVDTGLLAVKTISTCEFDLEAKYNDIVESYEMLSLNIQASNYIVKRLEKSEIISVDATPLEEIISPIQAIAKDKEKLIVGLTGGSNGSMDSITPDIYLGENKGPGQRTGIQAFLDNTEVSMMAIPGITEPNVQLALVAHCENLGSRFAILDIPRDKKSVSDVLEHRDIFDSEYAAMYNPWLEVYDSLDKKNTFIPPSGSVAGVYARTDVERGVFKAPANEVVRGVVGLDCQYNTGEQDILNPKGVNLIRSFTGQGIRIWGARTVSSNSLWKYVNVRRLFIFLEESIKSNTNWVVFEPNDELLWIRVKRTIEVFLENVWRGGALSGTTAAEAFFVDIGKNTMSEDDIANGRLVCVIGVAPVKPAEFVIFRITQKTNQQ